MSLRLLCAIYIGRLISLISRFFNIGAGATWSGKIALFIAPDCIKLLASRYPTRIVVAGTNGKTTTAAMAFHILGSAGYQITRNETGANMENGIAGGLIANGFPDAERKSACIFELDEAAFRLLTPRLKPTHIILLNLFRDQLDRYGEVDAIAGQWSGALDALQYHPQMIINADDPMIAHIGAVRENVSYFGLNDERAALTHMPHAADSNYCPACGSRLHYEAVFFSHIGKWQCPSCMRKRPQLTIDETVYPLPGIYNRYNALAATLLSLRLGIDQKLIAGALQSFQPAFGRQEEFFALGRRVKMLLSKNPASFNESIRTALVDKNARTVIVALNDRIPDGTDVSWIWDVDVEPLINRAHSVICTGDRVYDMGLRIKYSLKHENIKTPEQKNPSSDGKQKSNGTIQQFSNVTIEPNLKKAITGGIEKTPPGETLYILPTYSAMLEIRKILTGRKIL